MRKNFKFILSFMFLFLLVFLAACNGEANVGVKSATINDDNELVFTLTNDETINVGVVVGEDGSVGPAGAVGAIGETGVGIKTIVVNEQGELVVTLTDNKEINLGVVIGTDGADGADGEKGEKGDKGDKGETGDTGLTAYELYKKNFPGYTGTELEWLVELAKGNLALTVTVELNGGAFAEGYVAPAEVMKGEVINLENPTLEGAVFAGWFTDPEFENEFVAEVLLEDVSLYAKWEVELDLVLDGGQLPVENLLVDYDSTHVVVPRYNNIDWSGSEMVLQGTFNANWNNFALKKTEFAGLYTVLGHGPGYDNQDADLFLIYHDSVTGTYAPVVKSLMTAELTGTYVIIEKLVTPVDVYFLQVSDVTANVKLSVGTDVVALPVPQKVGYNFGGWFENADFSGEAVVEYPGVAPEGKTYYAKWDIKKFHVEFETGVGSAIETAVVDYNNKLVRPADPVSDDYNFVGWFTNSALTAAYDFETLITADLVLYAKWEHKYPEVVAILDSIPTYIDGDYQLPSEGVVWALKEGEDATLYDVETGTLLRLARFEQIIVVGTLPDEYSFEVTLAFGIADPTKTQFYYNANGTVAATGGTYDTQVATAGFEGYSIIVGGKQYFLGKKAYIALSGTEAGQTFSRDQLRPYGTLTGTSEYNLGLTTGAVLGTQRGYGVLYENTGDVAIQFDLRDTYGRTGADFAGYGKMIFQPQADGTYKVMPTMPATTAAAYMVTLNPGEMVWCPHTWETGGTYLYQPPYANGVLVADTIIEIRQFKAVFE